MPKALRDPKALQAFGLLFAHVDTVHPRPRRATAAEIDERLDRLGLALEHRLDRAVLAIGRAARASPIDDGVCGVASLAGAATA